jgi:hypothetical protein
MTEKPDTKAAAKAAETKPDAKAAEPKPAAKVAEPKTVTVICMARGGRRRGGRAWDEGKTLVPVAEMTAELRKALTVDPMFQVGD